MMPKHTPRHDLSPVKKGEAEMRRLRRLRQVGRLPVQNIRCAMEKRMYRTFERAKKVARIQMRRHDGLKLRVYRCRLCGYWHLTCMPKWKSKKKQGRS